MSLQRVPSTTAGASKRGRPASGADASAGAAREGSAAALAAAHASAAAAAAASSARIITSYRPLSAQRAVSQTSAAPVAAAAKPRTPSLAQRLLQRSPSFGSPQSAGSSLSPSPPPVAARSNSLLARQTSGSAANSGASFLSRPPTGISSNSGSPSAALSAASPPLLTRPASASSRTASPHRAAFHAEEVSADPFACDDDDPFAAATQPLDDEPSPRARPPAVRALSSSLARSASVSSSAGASSPNLARAASYSGAAASASAVPAASRTATSDLSGVQREAMDDLQFLLDGMRSAMAPVRSDSTVKLMHKMLGLELTDAEDGLASPATLSRSSSLNRKSSRTGGGNDVSPLMLMRACDGYKTLASLMPSTEELLASLQNAAASDLTAEHARLATLFVSVALVASQDSERRNAAHFAGRAPEILFSLAMSAASGSQSPATIATPTPASQSSASGSQSQGDESPSSATSNGGWGTLRQKRRQTSTKPLANSRDLAQLLQRQQSALMESQRSTEMDLTGALVERQEQSRLIHLHALPSLSYCALLALTAMAEDDGFVDHLLHGSDSATETVFQALIDEIQECRQKIKQIAKQEPVPQTKPARGKKAAVAAPAPSYELQLLQHRLACCISILECCMNHGAAYIASFSNLQCRSASGEPQPAMQLLFDVLLDFLPCLERRQQQALASKVSSDVPPSQLMLPVDDAAPIAPLLSLLRLLCNGSNRNEAGVAVLNREYQVEGHDKAISGLALVLRAVSSVRWSLLSHTLGHHDLFNLVTFALPVIVNCVEESADSRRIIDQTCTCALLPENAALISAALAALPPLAPSAVSTPAPAAGDISALDFVAGCWSFLYHQLQMLNAERDAKEAQSKAAAAPVDAECKTNMHDAASSALSTAQAASFDPFAAFAVRRAQMGGDSGAMLDDLVSDPIEAEFAATAAASDEEYEERCLGYRTLASMCSLLLGFFAVSPPHAAAHRSRILSSLHLADFAPLIRLISEFLLLQSDAQLLQPEGLQASFDMLQALKKCDRQATAAAAVAEAAPECSTFEEREKKRARLSASPPAAAAATGATDMQLSASPPAASPPQLGRSSSSAARFDALFGSQR